MEKPKRLKHFTENSSSPCRIPARGIPREPASHSYLCFFQQQIQLRDVCFHLALLTDEVLNIFRKLLLLK